MKRLSNEQMRRVVGGNPQQVYRCSCVSGGYTWQYEGGGGGAPSQGQLESNIHDNCRGGNAECGYATCGNPGVSCGQQ